MNDWHQTRWLERSLLFTLAIHALAMISMTLLLPGLPGGTQSELSLRAQYVADHPWIWRIGWFPWQVTAVSDLLLGVALIATPWVRKAPAILGAIITAFAIVPDQFAQFSWTTSGIALAANAVTSGDFATYSHYKAKVFVLSAGWGAAGYTLGAIAWTWSFVSAGVWNNLLKWLSIATWGLFAISTAIAFSPTQVRSSPAVTMGVSIGNALAFCCLMLWFATISECVLRRSRPTSSGSPCNTRGKWRHPGSGVFPQLCELVANSHLARRLGQYIPAASMSSDITDVIYINYLVDAALLEPLAVAPLELQRLGPQGRYAMFTFLTFRHGAFGPSAFGPLRQIWPSPIQSNWRIYVTNPTTSTRGVQFITTAITTVVHALCSRILADGVPMHIPAAAKIRRHSNGSIELRIDPGSGSAPDVKAELYVSNVGALPPPWNHCFKSWQDMLEYCVPQDRALCIQPGTSRVMRQEISLTIPLDTCKPLTGLVTSSTADAITRGAQPLCFLVDQVGFCFKGQIHD